MIKNIAFLCILFIYSLNSMQEPSWQKQHPNFVFIPSLTTLCLAELYKTEGFITDLKINKPFLPQDLHDCFLLVDKGYTQLTTINENEKLYDCSYKANGEFIYSDMVSISLNEALGAKFVTNFQALEVLLYLTRFINNFKTAIFLTDCWSKFVPQVGCEKLITKFIEKNINFFIKLSNWPEFIPLQLFIIHNLPNSLARILHHCRTTAPHLQRINPILRHAFCDAAQDGSTAVICILLNEGMDPNSYSSIPITFENGKEGKLEAPALYFAALNGHSKIVKCLLQFNANRTLTSNLGDTPLEIAQKYNHVDVVQLLKDFIPTKR